jgi:predicted DNA-binding transcriptional regulator YafY
MIYQSGSPKRSSEAQATRLIRLAELLQTRQRTTCAELGRELELSERQVRRNLEKLEALGYPVESVPGEGVGIRPQSSRSLPLTTSELLVLQMVAEQKLGGLGEPLASVLRGLLMRIQASLSPMAQTRLDQLGQRVHAQPQTAAMPVAAALETLTAAICAQRSVSVLYRGLKDADSRQRELDPVGLHFQDQRWYLHAVDHAIGQLRNFRLQRIERVTLLDQRFELPVEYAAKQAAFHSWDLGDDEPVTIRLEMTAELARWLRENPVHPSQTIQDRVAEVRVCNYAHWVDWFLSLRGARLLGPPALVKLVLLRTAEIAERHSGHSLSAVSAIIVRESN